jgi:hypothetical protein
MAAGVELSEVTVLVSALQAEDLMSVCVTD